MHTYYDFMETTSLQSVKDNPGTSSTTKVRLLYRPTRHVLVDDIRSNLEDHDGAQYGSLVDICQ